MNRREFLVTSAATAATALSTRFAWADDLPKDVKITRAVSFELTLTRPKHIGKNAYRHDHGVTGYDRVVRFYTNAGVDGFATSWAGANDCAALLGKSPFDLFHPEQHKIVAPSQGRYTSPLWDLVGKLLDKPVYELLGGSVRDRVPAYDGAIYFTDLRPPYRSSWKEEFKREFDQSVAMGHRAFKIKIGRGSMWMLKKEGYERDVEVVQFIRDHVGPDITLMVDANDGYDLQTARKFILDTANCNLAFLEEIVRDDTVETFRELKEHLRSINSDTKIADGENKRKPEQMSEWVEHQVVDILQGDMNLYGYEDILAEAAMAKPHGAQIAPHNWGSLFGYYLQLHAGKAIENFYMAEQDPMTCPAVITDGFKLSDGRSTVSDAPGVGLKLDENALADLDICNVHFDLRA
jgi:L-alanine-DL-glutamate epimerase-like enolase superfamily enzyme